MFFDKPCDMHHES